MDKKLNNSHIIHFIPIRIPIFIFLFFCVHFYRCQLLALDPAQSIHQYLIDEWTIAHGLPSNTIRSIAQTPDGYLWIATPKGLVRFDGIRFLKIPFVKNQEIKNKENIPPDTLFVDQRGILWIGSIAGLTRYHYKTGKFTTFTKKHGLTEDRFRCIKEDMRGNLWIGFFVSYLNRFANGKFTAFNASDGLEGKKINAIVEDRKGNLLFGTRENGVFKFLNETFFKFEIEGLGRNHLISTIYEDQGGTLWIGTNKGLFRNVDNRTNVYTRRDGLSDNYIRYIIEDNERNLWVGTVNGLNRMKQNQMGRIVIENMLEDHMILSLFQDSENSLWIGTYDSGIKRLKDGKFMPYSAIEKRHKEIIFSLFEDRWGNTWIGSLSGRLYRCRNKGEVESLKIPGISGTSISAIAEDDNGNLWLGTNGRGIFRKKGETYTNFTTREELADNLVISIFNDSKNNLWISTYDGVSRYHKGVFQSFKTSDGLLGKIVYNVYEDKNHHIWIATDKGVNVIKNGRFSKGNIRGYLKGIPVTCIHEDRVLSTKNNNNGSKKNVFWIATHGAGLKRFKDGTFISYGISDGMSSSFIYQMFEDERGYLWMMSGSGVLRISKKELNNFAQGRVEKINATSFGISDGMKSIEFTNKYSRHSALKTREGEFWFVTKKGITIVNPEEIKINKSPPPVVIEKVVFNDRPIHLSLHPEENMFKGINHIVFHFTAPSFLSPEKIKFKYQLDGYDRDWKYLQPGEERMACYKRPSPNTYTFKVTACNSDGIWNRIGDSITFSLKPFFYETGLFKIFVFLIILALAAGGYFLYKKRPFEKARKYKNSHLRPLHVKECIKKLTYLMEIEKLYRDETISLQSLSEKLSVTSHQLSQIINEKLNKNFPDFINTYRVEEVKKRLSNPKMTKQKILSIAFDVGFNTRRPLY
jgi:ligand-binding sensor domain-containing protein/AraC-like DNA-binding protein